MDWGRIRIFLTVARSGQILGAAKILGLNHATVGRQLTALEEEVQTKLVERHTDGCILTPAGELMLAAAEKVESEFLQLESGLSGTIGVVRGTVRIGAPDGLGNYFLAASLAKLVISQQELTIQLLPLPRTFSLSRRDADIVISLDRPAQGNLIVQKLTDYSLSLYGSEEYLALWPPIRSEEDLTDLLFVTYVDDMIYSTSLDYGRRLERSMSHHFECGSVVGQIEAVRAGHGIAILPDFAARPYPNLRQVLPDIQFTRSYWLISHPDTHNAYRVAKVRRHITDAVHAARSSFILTPAEGAAPA